MRKSCVSVCQQFTLCPRFFARSLTGLSGCFGTFLYHPAILVDSNIPYPVYSTVIARASNKMCFRREPSWCDRILFRVEEGHRDSERKLSCQQLNYDCISSYSNSDHKPVTSSFTLSVKICCKLV